MDEKFNRIPVSVIHFDKDGTVTDVEDYNLDKVEPDLRALKGLAAALLPVIREICTRCKFRYTLPKNSTTTNRWKSQVKIIAFISALVYTI